MKNHMRTLMRLVIAATCLALLGLFAATATSAQGPMGGTLYSVQYGDTMGSIAAGYRVTPQLLMQANGITYPNAIYPGQQMMVPSTSPFGYGMRGAPSASFGNAPNASFIYIVQRGDTLFGISRRFGVSVQALVSVNHIFNPNLIFAGMPLLIPIASPVPPPPPSRQLYIVQPGDTLTRIAIRFHTSVIALVIANNIPNPNLIFVGMRLIIPGATAPSPAPMPAPTMVPGMGMTSAISLMNIAYNPNALTVHAGTTIIWTNNESSAIPHTVTSGAPGAPSGTFDSPTLNPGQSFQFTFSTPGTITYYCRIHGPAMTGTVTVIP